MDCPSSTKCSRSATPVSLARELRFPEGALAFHRATPTHSRGHLWSHYSGNAEW